MRRLLRMILVGWAIVTVVGVFGLAALFTFLWWERTSDIALPAPTGAFAVGRTIQHWTDPHTADTLAPVPGTTRELLAWIWYPAAAASAVTDDYVPARMRAATPPPSGPFSYVTRAPSRVHTHSSRDAEVSRQAQPFPMLIMRGGASAGVVGLSTLAEDLASHGYVVVGFDAPYRTGVVVFPDGRAIYRTDENNPERCGMMPQAEQDSCLQKLLAAWTSDIGFAIDQLARMNAPDAPGRFAGRFDMSRVGIFGHSFGGAQAAQFCHDDARCKAAINVDGQPFGSVVQAGLEQPFMFLLSDHGEASDPVSRQIEANIQSIYDRLPPGARHRITIRGAHHFTFTDDGALLKSRVVRGLLRGFGVLGIDGPRQLAVTRYCVRSFFDTYVKGANPSGLELASPLYPEIHVLD